ncbi:hypothetical protein COCNU_scaffold022916G000010 [Cocos nucifera]|nr:hypothetical protein [Cocos nucifera]
MERAEKKAQIIQTKIRTEVRHLKEALKSLEEKLVATEARVAKVEVKGAELVQKAMEGFQALEELMNEKAKFTMKFYNLSL